MDPARDIDRRPPSEIAAALRRAIEAGVRGRRPEVLVGAGQFSPYPDHSRVGVLRLNEGGPPELVWDRFYPDASLALLRRELSAICDVFEGELDTMYATPWSYAWTAPSAPLRVYDVEGLIARRVGDVVHVYPRDRPAVTVSIEEIKGVLGWISDDWSLRGVSLVRRSGDPVVVAQVEDPIAEIDPTYDGINLMFEAAWAAQMGKALARALCVPYTAGDRALE